MTNLVGTVVDSLKADFEHVIENYRPAIEAGLADGAKVAANPVAEAVAGLVHIPPQALTGVAAALLDLDHELGLLKAAAKPADPTQPASSSSPALVDTSATAGPAGLTVVGSAEAQAGNAPA